MAKSCSEEKFENIPGHFNSRVAAKSNSKSDGSPLRNYRDEQQRARSGAFPVYNNRDANCAQHDGRFVFD
jgi:hypothetical protein